MPNPPPLTPGIGFMPDSSTNLWRKISQNWYQIALALGYTGDITPNALDDEISAQRKSVWFTAYIANNI